MVEIVLDRRKRYRPPVRRPDTLATTLATVANVKEEFPPPSIGFENDRLTKKGTMRACGVSDKSSRLERGIGTYIGQYTHDKVVDDPRGADAFVCGEEAYRPGAHHLCETIPGAD